MHVKYNSVISMSMLYHCQNLIIGLEDAASAHL